MTTMTSQPHWQPITAAELADAANVDTSARKAAVRGLPQATEQRVSESETHILEVVNGRISARAADVAQARTEIHSALVSVPTNDLAIASLSDDVVNRIINTITPFSGSIRKVVTEAEEAKATYAAFVEKHGLHEEKPPYKLSKIRHYAVLGAIGLGETVLATGMYKGASQAGLMGAFLAAAAVSGLNLVLGGLSGVAFRYVRLPNLDDDPNRQRRNQAWAIPSLIALGLAIVGVNGIAAHYREVASSAKVFTEAQVMAHAKAAPLDLSLWSIALFLLGVLCALLAGVKVWSSSPYPGYEKTHRDMVDKTSEQEALKQTVQGALSSLRTSEVDSLWDQRLAVDNLITDARRQTAALALKRRQAQELHHDDVTAGQQAIARYRRINETVRTDHVTPAYFATPPIFRPLGIEDDDGIEATIRDVTDKHQACAGALVDGVSAGRQAVELAKSQTERIMHDLARAEPGSREEGELMPLRAALVEARLQLAPPKVGASIEEEVA